MASTYLERTLSGTSTNRKLCTFSYWVKRSDISDTRQGCIGGFLTNSSGQNLQIGFYDNGFYAVYYDGAIVRLNLVSSALARDVSAWYHVVVAIDTTQATTSNRAKMYVNGVQVTSFTTSDYPVQNVDFPMTNGFTTHIGKMTFIGSTTEYFDGLMANVYFIDGTALDATSFGETDATTGIWKPKGYSGSYGTNGFFLKFENSASLGTDSSGNGNNFTVNGTPTQIVDTPSNVFATMNPLYQSVFGGTSAILTNGNTKWTGTSNGTSQNATLGTLGVSTGKWYWEVKGNMIYDYLLGIAKSNFDPNGGSGGLQNSGWWGLVTNISATGGAGLKFVVDNTFGSSTGTTLSNGDIINIALDATNLKFYIGKNGTWLNSGVPTSGATGTGSIATLPADTTFLPACSNYGYSSANSWEFNFGNGYFGSTAITSPVSDTAGLGKFQYTVPTGYYSLCTKNINSQG